MTVRVSVAGHECVPGSAAPVVAFHLPLRLVPQVNAREHWRKTSARAQVQKLTTYAIGRAMLARLGLHLAPPYRVTIVRIGPRRMDRDNAIGASKHVQDALARLLGVDDGDEALITFDYGRKIGAFGVDVVIEGAS